MKKTLLFCLIFSANVVFAQLTYVPDDIFEQKLIDFGYDDVLDDYVLTANINSIQSLNIGNQQISDLTGIKDFVALTELYCYNNQLSSLDVSNNTVLTTLYCSGNNLTFLDISQNLALTTLFCFENQLNSLDVSLNTDLTRLQCGSNLLTSLDTSQNSALVELNCGNNPLTSIDVSFNTALTDLLCQNTIITSLDLSQNINLSSLYCIDNQLTSLDVKNDNNANITFFNAKNNPFLTCIFVDDATYSTENWTLIDPTSTFVETQAECDTLGIDEIELNELIDVFPNPTNNVIYIQLSNEIEFINVVLYNFLGNVVIKTNKNYIDVSNLNTGIYILRIITKDDRIFSKRIIIENE